MIKESALGRAVGIDIEKGIVFSIFQTLNNWCLVDKKHYYMEKEIAKELSFDDLKIREIADYYLDV